MNDVKQRLQTARAYVNAATNKPVRKAAIQLARSKDPVEFANRVARDPGTFKKAAIEIGTNPDKYKGLIPKSMQVVTDPLIQQLKDMPPEKTKKYIDKFDKKFDSLSQQLKDSPKSSLTEFAKKAQEKAEGMIKKKRQGTTSKPPEGTTAKPPEGTGEGTVAEESKKEEDIEISPELKDKLQKAGIPPGLLNIFGKTLGKLEKKELLTLEAIDKFKSLANSSNTDAIQPYLNNLMRNPAAARSLMNNMNESKLEQFAKDVFEGSESNEATKLYEKVKTIGNKLKNKSPITIEENSIINNKDVLIRDLKKDVLYSTNNDYKNYVDELESYAEQNLTEKDTAYIKENEEKFLRDPEKIYFDDYAGLFKIILSLLTYLSIFLIIFILLLSIIALIKLVIQIIKNTVSLFVNSDNSSRSLSIDFLSKTITRCTKNNFEDDQFYIFTEQKQNISIFNIGVYVIYLIIFYFMLYFILFIYSKIMDKPIIGDPAILFKPPLFFTILAFIIGYTIVHLFLYDFIFKRMAYSAYKDLQKREVEIDTKIAEYILIYPTNGDGNVDKSQVLIDENFFEVIYDASRTDELNDIFYNGVKTEDAAACLEQKIMIYNIYSYLREYMPFSKEMQNKFKDYCTTTAENKKTFTSSNIPMTFVSLLNNSEIKMMRKYNEDLNYYNQIPDANIEYFNKLNTSITNKVKEINLLILVNTNTMIPFITTIAYICMIVILNFIILYLIIFIITIRKEETIEHFNPYIYMMLYKIKVYIYDPIIKYIISRY